LLLLRSQHQYLIIKVLLKVTIEFEIQLADFKILNSNFGRILSRHDAIGVSVTMAFRCVTMTKPMNFH